MLHHWLAERIRAGANVILLGDFNTEETGQTTRAESDLGIVSGLETPSVEDDLVDLNLKLAADDRQTHLLDGRQFDRILCSPSLLEDDPLRPDLVFTKIEIARDLALATVTSADDADVWADAEERVRVARAPLAHSETAGLDLKTAWGR